MNKFDIERFELLPNIKTDTGRQRAWLRNCLNEHSLERYTIAILANENLIRYVIKTHSWINSMPITLTFSK